MFDGLIAEERSTAMQSAPPPEKHDGFHYGWVVVATVFLAQALAVGTTIYGFGLLVKPIAADYQLTRAVANGGLMVLLLGMAIVSPFIGWMLDRLPGSLLVASGALIFGSGCLAIAFTHSLWLMTAITLLPLATGVQALGPLSASALTARWFERNRGRALGIVSVSSSAGGLLVLPLMTFFVERLGWRSAVAAMGGLVVILVVPLALLLIREPQRALPGQRNPDPSTSKVSPAPLWNARKLLQTRDFWLLAICIGLVLAVNQALLASLVAYGTDRGFSLQAASLVVSVVSGSAIIGKLVIGELSDHVDMRRLIVAVIMLAEVYLACLVSSPDYTVLLTVSLLAGAAIGGVTPLWAALISARFGPASVGTVMGLMIPVQISLTLLCLYYSGHSYDVSGNYRQAFAVFAGVLIIAGLAILPVKVQRETAVQSE
ncbi:MAG: MFS transporter [Pseudomonadales bacterium]|nr:MFS transporter [Pseudomonadales bacterium]